MAIYEKWPRSANIASEPAHKVSIRIPSCAKQHHVEATIDTLQRSAKKPNLLGSYLLLDYNESKLNLFM